MISNENLIILTDDMGNAVELEFLDLISFEGYDYAVLAQENSQEVIILEQVINQDGKTATYQEVLNDYVIEQVFNIFMND